MIDLKEAGDALVDALEREPAPIALISRRARSQRRRRAVGGAVAVTITVALVGGLVYRQTRDDTSLVIEPATTPAAPDRVEKSVPENGPADALVAAERFITSRRGRVIGIRETEIASAVLDGGGNSIYSLNRSGTALRQIAVNDLKVVAAVLTPPLSSLVSEVGTPLYATGTIDGSDATAFVERIEPYTLRPVWRVSTGAQPVIAAAPNLLWVESDIGLQSLDPNSGTVTATVELTAHGQVALTSTLSYTALYTATTPSGGGVATIETRDSTTGRVVATVPGPSGVSAPQLVPTPAGLWTVISGGHFVTASYFRGSPLRHVVDVGEIGANGTRLEYEATLSPVLWLDKEPSAIACLDPITGSAIATITDATAPHIIAVGQATVVVGAGGAVGIFRAHDLCPRVAP